MARRLAALITNTIVPWTRSTMSTVPATARRSCGLGRVGMTTRSATLITRWIAMLIAGGVSITTRRQPSQRRRSRSPGSWASVVETKAGRDAVARVPPGRERALRIGIDQRHRPGAGELGLDRQMARQRGLAGAALLRAERDDVHRNDPLNGAACAATATVGRGKTTVCNL